MFMRGGMWSSCISHSLEHTPTHNALKWRWRSRSAFFSPFGCFKKNTHSILNTHQPAATYIAAPAASERQASVKDARCKNVLKLVFAHKSGNEVSVGGKLEKNGGKIRLGSKTFKVCTHSMKSYPYPITVEKTHHSRSVCEQWEGPRVNECARIVTKMVDISLSSSCQWALTGLNTPSHACT